MLCIALFLSFLLQVHSARIQASRIIATKELSKIGKVDEASDTTGSWCTKIFPTGKERKGTARLGSEPCKCPPEEVVWGRDEVCLKFRGWRYYSKSLPAKNRCGCRKDDATIQTVYT